MLILDLAIKIRPIYYSSHNYYHVRQFIHLNVIILHILNVTDSHHFDFCENKIAYCIFIESIAHNTFFK